MMELDEEQRVVVESNKSTVCIAGPGSGKTRVLTEKARRLFNNGENILCLCFTRSAAREMSSRVKMLPATTIHSFCCGSVGWKDAWGYDGLLYRFLKLNDKPRFDWVLLDECQDVNEMELDVVLSLTGDKLFAVGDPYQSIYGFQGAMGPKVIRWLAAMDCDIVELHNSYRGAPHIIDRLNGIFSRGLISKGIKNTGLTCILCRKNEDLFYASRFLEDKGIPHGVRLSKEVSDNREYNVVGESNLRLMTIHCSKGHEFDKVILFNWKPNEKGEEERVYYVAIARASKEFVEVSSLRKLEGVLQDGRSSI